MVAFDRYLARLVHEQPDAWILKGGLALQFRRGDRARTTKDIDLLLTAPSSGIDLQQLLVQVALMDLNSRL